MPSYQRLSNAENDYLENTTAAANTIIQRAKQLAYWLDHDPEALVLVLDIMRTASSIRKATIEWKRKRKRES